MRYYEIKDKVLSVVTAQEKEYLYDCFEKINASYSTCFVRIFSTLHRHLSVSTRSQTITIVDDDLIINNWEIVQTIRVLFIHTIKEDNPDVYFAFVDRLFAYSSIDELTALYASLPILKYPAKWQSRCAEGIRNNIENVQKAVMLDNKYPANYLDEVAWNQLVLKSFFTNKNVLHILGLFDRNNQHLAESIVDYIYERHSAKRDIHPILWLLAKHNLQERALNILQQTFEKTTDRIVQSILFHVMLVNKDNLKPSIDLESQSNKLEIIPFSEEVLEAYNNGKLCVQI